MQKPSSEKLSKKDVAYLKNLQKSKAKIHASLLLHDLARLEYGRILWKNPRTRRRLTKHWTNTQHPYHNRYRRFKKDVNYILGCDPTQDDQLNQELLKKGLSLRVLVREIPPVIGSIPF